jgi:Fe-S-cluster containining protein
MPEPLYTLQPLRFECLACGSCCQGVRAELEDDEEADRIRRIAVEMEVEEPIVDGFLRQEKGTCPFLAADGKCGIHARYGAEAKPLVCRQFPYVLLDTESGARAGVDPSSFHTLATWHTAPPYSNPVGTPRRSRLDPANVRVETAIIARCSAEGATVASVLGMLCGAPDHAPQLPPGFASRLATRLKRMHLDILLQAPDGGPAQRDALLPLVELIADLDPENPPSWPALAPNEDAFAVEVTRRMVFLRLVTKVPIVQGVALLMLSGAVALGWACPDPERYGPAIASWSRLIRAGSFWQSLTPSPMHMQWLASGGVEAPGG